MFVVDLSVVVLFNLEGSVVLPLPPAGSDVAINCGVFDNSVFASSSLVEFILTPVVGLRLGTDFVSFCSFGVVKLTAIGSSVVDSNVAFDLLVCSCVVKLVCTLVIGLLTAFGISEVDSIFAFGLLDCPCSVAKVIFLMDIGFVV